MQQVQKTVFPAKQGRWWWGVTLALVLAGCGSKADPGFSPANPVNITIWTYYNGEQLEAFNALVDEFNSTVGKEQGITVESSSHGSVTDLENNVLASAEGKVGAEAMPNIFSAYADTAYALDEWVKLPI